MHRIESDVFYERQTHGRLRAKCVSWNVKFNFGREKNGNSKRHRLDCRPRKQRERNLPIVFLFNIQLDLFSFRFHGMPDNFSISLCLSIFLFRLLSLSIPLYTCCWLNQCTFPNNIDIGTLFGITKFVSFLHDLQ